MRRTLGGAATTALRNLNLALGLPELPAPPGELLHGLTVRSPAPRGRIREVRFLDGVPWAEFTIVTAADIPGHNYIALIENDQPCLAAGQVNHAEEPVVLLAHRDRALLEKARQLVVIDIEPLPAVFDLDESLAQQTIIWGRDNLFKGFTIEKGAPLSSPEAWAEFRAKYIDIPEADYRRVIGVGQ